MAPIDRRLDSAHSHPSSDFITTGRRPDSAHDQPSYDHHPESLPGDKVFCDQGPASPHARSAKRRLRGDVWTPSIVAVLAAAVLLILVWQAAFATKQLQDDTNQTALLALADSLPVSICVNATEEAFQGATAAISFACADPGNYFHIVNSRFGLPELYYLVWMLVECDVVQGWYEVAALSAFLNGTGQAGPISDNQDVLATFHRNMNNYHEHGFTNSPDLRYFIRNVSPDFGNQVFRQDGNLTMAAMQDFLTSTSSSSLSSDALETSLHNVSYFTGDELAAWGMLDGTLRLSMLEPLERVTVKNPVWLNLHQDADTAQCMGAFLQTIWALLVQDNMVSVDPCVYSGNSTYLVPHAFEAYSCVNQLDRQYWSDWANVLAAVQAQHVVTFLFMKGTFNDLYAQYTGALGALFGAFALAVVSLACSGAVTFILFMPEGHFARLRAGKMGAGLCAFCGRDT